MVWNFFIVNVISVIGKNALIEGSPIWFNWATFSVNQVFTTLWIICGLFKSRYAYDSVCSFGFCFFKIYFSSNQDFQIIDFLKCRETSFFFFQITVFLTQNPKTSFHGVFYLWWFLFFFLLFILFLYLPINIGKINKMLINIKNKVF